jgi:hypothetical protein
MKSPLPDSGRERGVTLKGVRKPRRRNAPVLGENVTENIVRIFHGNAEFRLRVPITLKAGRSGSYVTLSYAPLSIVGRGKNELDALASFAAQFGEMWEHLSSYSDRQLPPETLKLKRAFENAVESVEAA